MPTRRRLFPALLLLVGFTASACAAFYVPDVDDDLVQRCNTSEDCDPIDDNRYVAQCVFGEGQPENSDKVCAADIDRDIVCGEMAYDVNHPLSVAYEDAVAAKAAYGQCSEENYGKRGCPPMDGACDDPLEINNASGTCDDLDDPIPAIYPPGVGGIDIAGQDAKDQFCRWYFCDETMVCVPSGSKQVCRPCSGKDPDDFGDGGCGEIYIQGEPSSIYMDADAGNCNGNRATTEAEFGPAPMTEP